jgi:hypothetical protein
MLHRLRDGETTLHPIRLDRVHEAPRLTSRSSVQKPRLHAAALSTWLADVLVFIAHNGQSGMPSALYKRENDFLAVFDRVPSSQVKKGLRVIELGTAPWCLTRCRSQTR